MSDEMSTYRRLPYTRIVEKVQHEGVTEFVGYIAEIPWIRIYADEREEAYLILDETFGDALQAMIDSGDDIPLPEGSLDRYGEPENPEPITAARWSRGEEPTAGDSEANAEPESWESGSVDPKRELEPAGA